MVDAYNLWSPKKKSLGREQTFANNLKTSNFLVVWSVNMLLNITEKYKTFIQTDRQCQNGLELKKSL